eukprot:CAMPEP_0194757386 /NCGR_PEP_ID=MMETSP0323_2-20130528/10893_1 /TAXON_ID=2866 ORGANISM="Crypthecodinium cohnii, Strain Seligo" /NCGR_SAMPLE_ID=MMETSP0323_2 /ASSEMBLY_ACC=CAM_ASM_000346 /LENGTH=47 /DNA_ID= /DNA_START= /DNA_END= /DNA_ORIENTATION=
MSTIRKMNVDHMSTLKLDPVPMLKELLVSLSYSANSETPSSSVTVGK